MILSQLCHTADHPAVAITKATQDGFHRMCPGLCIESVGKVEKCECECHGEIEYDPAEALHAEVLLPRAVSVSPGGGLARHKDSVRTRSAPTGRCEHCGVPTGGRFAPGHDAKLKSTLVAGARQGNFKDVAELVLRGWPIPEGIDVSVESRGEAFAQQYGYDLVDRRNAARQGDTVSGD
jgi:hypothetical protein